MEKRQTLDYLPGKNIADLMEEELLKEELNPSFVDFADVVQDTLTSSIKHMKSKERRTMATVKRSKRLSKKKSPRSKSSGKDWQSILPMKPRKPVDDWMKYSYLIHGAKKIGKTAFAAMPDWFIFQCDRPQLAKTVI